jgi:hypothetical protein
MNLCFDRKRRLRVVVTDDLPETIDPRRWPTV